MHDIYMCQSGTLASYFLTARIKSRGPHAAQVPWGPWETAFGFFCWYATYSVTYTVGTSCFVLYNHGGPAPSLTGKAAFMAFIQLVAGALSLWALDAAVPARYGKHGFAFRDVWAPGSAEGPGRGSWLRGAGRALLIAPGAVALAAWFANLLGQPGSPHASARSTVDVVVQMADHGSSTARCLWLLLSCGGWANNVGESITDRWDVRGGAHQAPASCAA